LAFLLWELLAVRAPILVEARAAARWPLEFVHDQFANGRRFRILNVLDDVTRECLPAIPDTSISGQRVARELTDLIERRGKPALIVSDNGTEFTSRAVPAWAQESHIDWHFIAPRSQIATVDLSTCAPSSQPASLASPHAESEFRRFGNPF
jgi:putative transposase